MIVLMPPWTAAEEKQLYSRIWRQGQSNQVEVLIPTTFANINGERWSWCESRIERLTFKQSLANAVLNGALPAHALRSPQEAYQDAIKWLMYVNKKLESFAW